MATLRQIQLATSLKITLPSGLALLFRGLNVSWTETFPFDVEGEAAESGVASYLASQELDGAIQPDTLMALEDADFLHLLSLYSASRFGTPIEALSRSEAARAFREAGRAYRTVSEERLRRTLSEGLAAMQARLSHGIGEVFRVPPFRLPKVEPFVSGIDFHALVRPALSDIFQTFAGFDRLVEKLETLSLRGNNSEELLWSIGWVIDMEMPIYYIHEAAALVDGRRSRAHASVARYYAWKLGDIESSLVRLHPERASILKAAFEAHRRKEYSLSVPVLLAQCDGMSHDILATGLYEARGAHVVSAIERSRLGSYMKRTGATLMKSGPIHAEASALDPATDPLNRHQVLHGRSTTYGTQLKSLQAIALTNFVGVVLTEALEEAKNSPPPMQDGIVAIKAHPLENSGRRYAAITIRNGTPDTQADVRLKLELLNKKRTRVLGVALDRFGTLAPGQSKSLRVPMATGHFFRIVGLRAFGSSP